MLLLSHRNKSGYMVSAQLREAGDGSSSFNQPQKQKATQSRIKKGTTDGRVYEYLTGTRQRNHSRTSQEITNEEGQKTTEWSISDNVISSSCVCVSTGLLLTLQTGLSCFTEHVAEISIPGPTLHHHTFEYQTRLWTVWRGSRAGLVHHPIHRACPPGPMPTHFLRKGSSRKRVWQWEGRNGHV